MALAETVCVALALFVVSWGAFDVLATWLRRRARQRRESERIRRELLKARAEAASEVGELAPHPFSRN